MILRDAASTARFSPEKMGKSTLAAGDHMFVGLNAFEPGQEHSAHSHADQDKLYVVLEGAGEVTVGGQTEMVGPGDIAFAAAGIPHSMRNTGASRLVVMAVLSPRPAN